MRKKKIITLFLLFLIAVLSCINTEQPKDVFLNHIGTLVIFGLMAWDIYKQLLSWSSFLCIGIFCFFHIIGARYLYSFVPYNDWSVSAFNWDMNAHFQCSRNHYDRFVHFIFGILILPVLMELFSVKNKVKYSYAILLSWLTVQTFSMLYELIEWLVALLLSAKHAENYNGQQGDIWDAHKDMALALLGSTIMCTYYLLKRKSSSCSV